MKLYLFLALLLITSSCGHPSYEAGEKVEADILEVVDGDTIKVDMEKGGRETIRLLLVDTPETVHPDKPVQPYGAEASAFAKEYLPENKNVTIEIDTSIRDDYDRFLAYIWVDGEMFNEKVIEEGLARVAYIIEPNTRYVDRLQQTEEKAREENRGIWSEEGYVTDEGFNPDAVQSGSCESPDIKGNHSSSGDYIYHTPDSPYYDETEAEEMFCSEEEAEEAGFRPVRQ
ncbi:thermonuclease family protein [Salibacterium aidingense]|uniref:thermonuclease family protein n=1 Tax=Salibacterium aidingense TaxID=384933 RepID=UPI003BD028A1